MSGAQLQPSAPPSRGNADLADAKAAQKGAAAAAAAAAAKAAAGRALGGVKRIQEEARARQVCCSSTLELHGSCAPVC